MRIGHCVRKYVYPIGYTWVREVKSLEKIPVWVRFFGEDDEMRYYDTIYREGYLWGIRKEA